MADELDSSLRRRQWADGSGGWLLPDLHEAGRLLPGNKIVPERIRENREPYYAALKAADRAWDEGHFDVSELADI